MALLDWMLWKWPAHSMSSSISAHLILKKAQKHKIWQMIWSCISQSDMIGESK